MRNGLYIIATPIGNLQDISQRALEIMKEASVMACEDTRVTKKLCSLLGIGLQKKFVTYQDHNEEEMAQKIADLAAEQAVVLVSDAGSPLISDPGYKLVRLCRQQDIYVTAIPGACAIIAALQLSGLPTNRFMFAGFIPNKDKARQDLFSELAPIDATLIFYETAPRLLKTLEQAKVVFGGREVSVVREITKMYEETQTGPFDEVMTHFTHNEPKGEFVVLIAPPQNKPTELPDIRPLLAERLKQTSLKTAVKEICAQTGLNKNDVYALALEIKNEQLS